MPDARVVVSFEGVPTRFPVVRYETHSSFAKHSVNVLDLRTGTALGSFPEWTPVTVDLSYGARSERWYGYVHHYGAVDDSRANATGKQITRYTLIGTSLPLNEERTRSWHNMTRSGVVRQVARDHGLRSIVQSDREILPYIAQAGISDMALLQKFAEETGYRLWVDGSTLRYFDPDLLLSGARLSDIQTYTKSTSPSVADSVISWSSKAGSMLPRPGGSGGAQTVYGLDRRTGTVIGVTSDRSPASLPSVTKIDTTAVVNTASQAALRARGNSKRTQAWITAKAVLVFSPGIKPGDVVNVAGDAIKAAEQGLWLITGVSHRVLNDGSSAGFEYTTTVDLERDGIYSPQFNTALRTINTRDLVPARIRNGSRWEAEVMEDIRIG